MMSGAYEKKHWSELKVGKGVDVAKIPEWLTGLAQSDSPRWDASDLTCLYKPGKIYSAAAKAVPELIELLRTSKTPNKDTILMIAGSLVCAKQSTRLVWGLDFNRPDIKKFYSSGVAKEVWKSTWEGRNTYLELLNDSDAMVRSGSAFMLAFDFKEAKNNIDKLAVCLPQETEIKTKASMLLSVGLLQSYLGERKKSIDLAAYANKLSEDPLVRGAAVIAQIYSSKELVKLTADQKETLIEWCHLSEVDVDGYPWNNGVTDMHACRVVEGRCEEGALVAAEILAECIRRYGQHWRVHDWASGILSLAFPEADIIHANGPFLIDASIFDFSQFSDRHRALMELLSSYEFDAPFQAHGMPDKISDRQRWLGLEEPGPMERVVEVEVLGKLRKWPVWKCMKEQYASKPFHSVDVEALLGKVLTPTQLLEVRLEYSKMAYGLAWGGGQLGDEVFKEVMEHSHEMLPYARKHLRYMSRMFNEFGAVHVNNGSKAAITAMYILIKEGFANEILPEDDILLAPGLSEIYKHFDLTRREKLIVDRLKTCFLTDDSAFWYAKHNIHSTLENLEHFTTEKVANTLFDLRDHILENFDGFSEERSAIEIGCQKHVDKNEGFAKVVKERL